MATKWLRLSKINTGSKIFNKEAFAKDRWSEPKPVWPSQPANPPTFAPLQQTTIKERPSLAMFSKRLLITLAASGVAVLGYLATTSFHEQQRQRFLRHLEEKMPRSTEPIGTLKLDIYRTFDENFLYRSYAIPEWRVPVIISSLNNWFEGRVKFELGDVYDYHNAAMYSVPNGLSPCQLIREFADSPDRQHKNRVAIVGAASLGGILGGIFNFGLLACTTNGGNPLGYNDSPAIIWGTDYKSLGEGSLAHAMGHVLGLGHTSNDFEEGVNTYNECGMDLKYPYYNNAALFDKTVEGEDGTVYEFADWEGQYNIMARFTILNLLQAVLFGKMGVYRSGYTEVFESITQCYFSQSINTEL